MATLNPLEQKARSSFIKGFVIALLIGILVSAYLGLQLYQKIGEEKQRQDSLKNVLVLAQNVSSGQLLTENMFTTKKVDPDIAQTDSLNAYDKLKAYFLTDKYGNKINTTVDKEGNTKYTITPLTVGKIAIGVAIIPSKSGIKYGILNINRIGTATTA